MTETLAWVRRKRLEFIEFRLIWYGKVNRSDLTDRFSMSPPQATGDLEKYREIAPDNMIYDPTERTFVRGPGFRRELTIGQSDRHLMQMEAIEHGFLDRSQTWFGDLPPVEVLELKRRPVADEVITVVADAIRQKRKLRGIYWTMSGKPPAARVLTPHAFAYCSHRWHIRAFDEGHAAFRDYNLGRLTDLELLGPADISSDHDYEWHTFGNMLLAPNPKLTDEKREAVRHDYAFDGEMLEVRCRLALLFYMRREFDLDDDDLAPERRPLLLVNAAELEAMRANALSLARNAIASDKARGA